MRGLTPATARFFTWLLIPTALFCAFAGNRVDSASVYLFNSDLVQAYMVGEDLLASPLAVLDWYHWQALYVFPDWLLAGGMAAAWPGSDRLLPLFYATALLAAYSAAAGALVQQAAAMPAHAAAWLFAAVTSVTALVAPAPAASPISSYWLFMTSSSPFVHTGSLIMTLVAAAVLMRLLRDQSRPLAGSLIGICVVMGLSDAMFLVWFVAPAVVVLLLAAWAGGAKRLMYSAAILGAVALLTRIVEPLLRGASSLAALNRVSPIDSVRHFLRDVLAMIMHGDAGFILMTLIVPIIVVRGALIAADMLRGRAQSAAALGELFLAGSIAAALLAPLAAGLYTEPWLMRYFLIVPILVVIWTLSTVVSHASVRMRRNLVFCGVAATLMVGAASAWPAWLHGQQLQRPDPLESCLAAHRRHTGIGDYWSAKGLMFSSGRRIHVIQVDASGRPFRINYKKQWFHRHAGTGAPLRPDFIIMTRLDPVQIEKRFSRPQAVVDCAGEEIWLYEEPIDFRPG